MRANLSAWGELCALGWAIGLALFTFLLFILTLVGLSFAVSLPIATAGSLAILLPFGIALYGQRRTSGVYRRTAGVSRRLDTIVLTVAALLVIARTLFVACRLAVTTPLARWDSWAVWAIKARYIVAEDYYKGYLHDSTSHPDYPLHLPFLEATLMKLGGPNWTWMSMLIGPAYLILLCLLFYVGLRRLYTHGTALSALCILSLLPLLPSEAASGYADTLLALYYGGAVLYLMLWWSQQQQIDAVIMALLAGAAAWTKHEGMIALVLVLCFYSGLLLYRSRPRWISLTRQLIPVWASGALFSVPWVVYMHSAQLKNDDYMPITIHTLLTHLDRLPVSISYMGGELINIDRYSIFWIAIIVTFIIRCTRLSSLGYVLCGFLFLQLMIDAGIYVFSTWQPFTQHIVTSLSRLLLQIAPAATLLLVEMCAGRSQAQDIAPPVVTGGLISNETAA